MVCVNRGYVGSDGNNFDIGEQMWECKCPICD